MLKQRIITALIIGPLFLLGLFATTALGFSLFLALIVTIAGWEWSQIAGYKTPVSKLLYAVFVALALYLSYPASAQLILGMAGLWWALALYLILNFPASKTLWEPRWFRTVAGFFVLVPAWKALVSLRLGVVSEAPDVSTVWLILYIFLVVWCADIGAYFAGKNFGRRKLLPKVSPGKSVEGVMGGLVAVSVLPFAAMPLLQISPAQTMILWMITLSTALVSVLGDLLESLGKRVAEIKDSSQILPGHGGILDRIDSVTAAGPIFVLLAIATGWVQA